jgi:hypothetical protein
VTVSIVSEVHTVVEPTPVSDGSTDTTSGKYQEREADPQKIELNYWESLFSELRAHQPTPLPEKQVRREAQRLPIPFNSFVSLASQIRTQVRPTATAAPTGGSAGTGGGGGASPGGGALPTGSVDTPSRKHQGREADPEPWFPVPTIRSALSRLGSVAATATLKPTPTWGTETSREKNQVREVENAFPEDPTAEQNIPEELLDDPETIPLDSTTDDTDDFIADLYNIYLAEGDFTGEPEPELEPELVPEPQSLFERQPVEFASPPLPVVVPVVPVYTGKPVYTEKPTITVVAPVVPVYTKKPVYSEKPTYTGKPMHTGKPSAQ